MTGKLSQYITPTLQSEFDRVQNSKYFSVQNNGPVQIPLYITEFMPQEHIPNTISVIQGTQDFKDSQILLQTRGIPITMTLQQQIQKWDDKREQAAKQRRVLAKRRDKFQVARGKHFIKTGQDIPNPWKDVEPTRNHYHSIINKLLTL